MSQFNIDWKYPYRHKEGGRSSSLSVSAELKDELEQIVGRGNMSSFMERASWLLLAMLDADYRALDEWAEWFVRNAHPVTIQNVNEALEHMLSYGEESNSQD